MTTDQAAAIIQSTIRSAEAASKESALRSGEVMIKICWLKQRKRPGSGAGAVIVEFEERQNRSFDPAATSFRMVKNACSYPVPPHKVPPAASPPLPRRGRSSAHPTSRTQVRMWCSSFGASPDIPHSMDLHAFTNTFELITEERHTLTMAHLSGGETIAFEMLGGGENQNGYL